MKGILLVPLAALLMSAQFAAFTVSSKGVQQVDLATGVTTLMQGGVITDNRNHLTLEGGYIQYKEGVFIKAKAAEMHSNGVSFTAAVLDYQDAADTVRLTGGLTYANSSLKGVKAQEGLLYLKTGIAVLHGRVRSLDPLLHAEKVVVDADHNQILVLGRFSYKDPKLGITLNGNTADATLLLTMEPGGKLPEFTSRVPKAVLVRLTPYAAKL